MHACTLHSGVVDILDSRLVTARGPNCSRTLKSNNASHRINQSFVVFFDTLRSCGIAKLDVAHLLLLVFYTAFALVFPLIVFMSVYSLSSQKPVAFKDSVTRVVRVHMQVQLEYTPFSRVEVNRDVCEDSNKCKINLFQNSELVTRVVHTRDTLQTYL